MSASSARSSPTSAAGSPKRRGRERKTRREASDARAAGRKIGICGQAPSDYPEFAEFLIGEGIDSISLNPDVVLKMTIRAVECEGRLAAGATKSGIDSKPVGARFTRSSSAG